MGRSAADDADPVKVLAFHAEWCSACKRDMPTILRLTASGEYYFFMVDYDERPEVVEYYGVSRIPTYIILDDDWEEVYRTGYIEDLE